MGECVEKKKPGPAPEGWARGFSVRLSHLADSKVRELSSLSGETLTDIVRLAVDKHLGFKK